MYNKRSAFIISRNEQYINSATEKVYIICQKRVGFIKIQVGFLFLLKCIFFPRTKKIFLFIFLLNYLTNHYHCDIIYKSIK